MANEKITGANKEYAIVDTQPGSAGYFTNEVNIRHLQKTEKVSKVFFSIREHEADISAAPSALSVITVVLQFKCDGDHAWSDFIPLDSSEFVIGNRVVIEDTGANVVWRAGVRDDEYTSGSVTFGFDW